jgi:hypothetical protein
MNISRFDSGPHDFRVIFQMLSKGIERRPVLAGALYCLAGEARGQIELLSTNFSVEVVMKN